ncbi:LuxR C-terminal-related transcriptional regulator [Actinomadura sp. SCN-SB]|uniref:LuxR C-terminal-related transcriptional regulator n=1 Tax=Actinomadura sp. SCN-SB TaxID=3373092 RepID=UPI0037511B5C
MAAWRPAHPPSAEGSWPFVGRTTELAAVRSALLDARASGVIVVGDAGVGKTWLAGKVAAHLDPRRNLVVRAKATEAAARIPYGALAHLLPADPAPGEGPRLDPEAVAGPGRRLVLAVDDVHNLDPASTALIVDVLGHGGARLLAAARTGAQIPAPLDELYRDGALHRLELGPLSHAQTALLLETVVGGQVDDAGARRMWRIAGGNPLFLRELVLAGMLTESGGVWRCAAGPTLTPRLRELIEARIGAIDDEERRALEYLALGEPLDEALLRRLAGADAVGRVTARQLVTAIPDEAGGRLLRLSHALYAEAVRAGMGPLAARARLRRLAEAVEDTGTHRREDVLRLATWRLDSGGDADPRLLLRAARIAWSGFDLELAARLASAALNGYLARPARRPGGAGMAAALLATVLHFADRDEEAEVALSEVAGRLRGDRERALHAGARALVLALGLADDRAGQRVLDEAATTVTKPESRRHLLSLSAWIHVTAGRLTEAAGAVERSRALVPAGPPVVAATEAADALLHAYGGRSYRAIAVAEAAMDDIAKWRDEVPIAMAYFTQARTVAHLFAGETAKGLDGAARGLGLVREFGEWDRVAASFSGWRAQLHRLRGELGEAMRWSRNGTARLGDRSAMYAGLCYGELACAAAQLGRVDEAEWALDRAADLSRPAWHGVEFSILLARPWVLAARGDTSTGVDVALVAADDAEEHGLLGYAMFALHDAVRLREAGDASLSVAAERLEAVARRMEGALAPLCARHARAAVNADADGLMRVAEEFEGRGLILYAAESAAQAAGVHEAAGDGRRASAATARARALAARCDGPRTPALAHLSVPRLTDRQRQIAQLAAQDLTDREIADRLEISVRTVGNHLATVYERLGVSGRGELAELLAGAPPASR